MRSLPLYILAVLFSFLAVYFFINIGHIKIFAFFLVLIVMLITFQSPTSALYVLIISMLLSPEIPIANVPGRSVTIRFDDFMVIMIFFTYLFKMAINKELGLLKASPLNINLLSLIIVMLVSTLLGVMTWNVKWTRAFFYLLKMVEYYILFFLVLNNIKDEAHIEKLINLMFFVCFIVCVYAYTQVFHGLQSTAPFEGGPNEAEPASFGGYLLVIYGQILGFLLYSDKKNKFFPAFLFAFSIVPFLYSQSRASYIGLVVFFLSGLLLFKKARVPIFIAAIIAAVMFISRPPEVVTKRVVETFISQRQEKIMGKEIKLDESSLARIDAWKTIILKRFPKRPFFGFGITGVGFVDSQYVLYMGEIGLIGIIMFFILIIRMYYFSLKVHDLGKSWLSKAVSFGLISSLSGLLMHAVTSNSFIIIRIMEPFWFLAACVMFLHSITKTESETGKSILSGKASGT